MTTRRMIFDVVHRGHCWSVRRVEERESGNTNTRYIGQFATEALALTEMVRLKALRDLQERASAVGATLDLDSDGLVHCVTVDSSGGAVVRVERHQGAIRVVITKAGKSCEVPMQTSGLRAAPNPFDRRSATPGGQ